MSKPPSIEDVSDTALWVAAFRAEETQRPDALFRDPFAKILIGDRGRELARAMPYPKILGWIMAVRTVAIDRLVFEALDAGVDTVINLGAGLDTRPYRLDLPSTLRWIEIDFPRMVALKNEKLRDEKPRCQLKRIGLDLTDRPVARKAFAELGASTKKALVITEGVIAYLANEQAGLLADDLRNAPGFHYWIQDYNGNLAKRPSKLRKSLKKAPFLFDHHDPLGFFQEHGWNVKTDILAFDESKRIGREFPMPLLGRVFMRFMPKKKLERLRHNHGYALLTTGSP